MPKITERIAAIMPAGKSGWEIHFAALARLQAGENLLMVTAGDHDFDTPSETVEACIAALRAGHHHYGELGGRVGLREAMAKVSTQCTGVETSPSEVLATTGGQGALFAAVQATCDFGDHAVIVGPYYATYPGTFRAAGASFTVVDAPPENGFEPVAAEVEEAVTDRTRAILINSPNNPTGAVYSEDALEAIAGICQRHDLWLISDEVYWTHPGEAKHVSPRALPGMAGRTLVVNSLSKSHGMTGWRVGWLTGPESVITPLVGLNLVSNYGLNDFVSRAAAEALEHAWGVEEISALYWARRRAFLHALGEGPGYEVHGSKGGIYVMIDVRAVSHSGEAFAWDLLDAEKLAVMPGESFGEATAGHVRVSLCQPEEVLAEAAVRFRRYVESRLAG